MKRLQNENVLARARLAKADIEKEDKEEQNRLLAFQLGLLLDMVRRSPAHLSRCFAFPGAPGLRCAH